MDQENMPFKIIQPLEKEFPSFVDEPGRYHVKGNKPDPER